MAQILNFIATVFFFSATPRFAKNQGYGDSKRKINLPPTPLEALFSAYKKEDKLKKLLAEKS